MSPHIKLKNIDPETRNARCLKCQSPTTADHYPDETVFTRACSQCKTANNPNEHREKTDAP